jgi:hypothetical protein
MVRVSKTQLVLLLYSSFKSGEKINMEEFCTEHSVSIPTFKRYIQEIRCFLMNEFINEELIYSVKDRAYMLIKHS